MSIVQYESRRGERGAGSAAGRGGGDGGGAPPAGRPFPFGAHPLQLPFPLGVGARRGDGEAGSRCGEPGAARGGGRTQPSQGARRRPVAPMAPSGAEARPGPKGGAAASWHRVSVPEVKTKPEQFRFFGYIN